MKKRFLMIFCLFFSASHIPFCGNAGEIDVKADATRYKASILEAARSGSHPERRTALLVPDEFDVEAFEADPDGYLTTVEPGRIHQTAEPGPGVPALWTGGPAELRMGPGGELELGVTGEANAPVTFHSTGLGAFENGLTTITVRADGAGAASAVFTATAGTLGDVNVVAASPMAVGKVCFSILVE